jgi:hypothetical protein
VAEKYRLYAGTGADGYWIDDDVRSTNHRPASWGCFCDVCVAEASAALGLPQASREELLASLNSDLTARQRWVARQERVMGDLLETAASSIAAVDPAASIGLMTTGATPDSGANLDTWLGRMKNVGFHDIWLRPGGGFWDDESPRSMLGKVYRAAQQRFSVLHVAKATYEIESYPQVLGNKSRRMSVLEPVVALIAADLDGVMFDILDQAGNPLEEYSPLFQAVAAGARDLRELHQLTNQWTRGGWWAAFSPRHAVNILGRPPLVGEHDVQSRTLALQTAGIPMTSSRTDSSGHLLDEESARGMDADELLALLHAPTIMDGGAASVYVERGLGEAIGVNAVQEYTEGVAEEFSEHVVNGRDKGYRRAITLQYFGESSYAITPGPSSESLSRLIDSFGRRVGDAATLAQSPFGTPVSVLGHLPWKHVLSPARTRQLRTLTSFMLPGLMPELDGGWGSPIVIWPLRKASGRMLAMLNAGFDQVDDLTIQAPGAEVFGGEGVSIATGAKSITATLPPWGLALVEIRS